MRPLSDNASQQPSGFDRQQFQEALDKLGGPDVTGFTVISKESANQLKNQGTGALRLPSDITVTVKFIPVADLADNAEALEKLIKAANSGRLGAARDDGVLLFHEDLIKHLGDNQTVLIRNKVTGEEETRSVTVESISSENYQIVQAALAILNPLFGSHPEAKKEEETKSGTKSNIGQIERATTRQKGAPVTHSFARQAEKKLNQIETGQDAKAVEAREKEKAEQKERIRQEKEQAYLRKENLKWDVKQETIEKSNQKHDSKKI